MKNLLLSSVIILIIGYLASIFFIRFDLTSEKRYTLSDYTKKLLKSNTDDIYIKVYLSGDDLSVDFKKMSRSLKELLDEFKAQTGSNLEYEFINPTASSDKKVRYALYQQLLEKGLMPIESQEVSDDGKTSQKMVFPCVLISMRGKEIGVNLLKNDPHYAPESPENINNSIQTLEYEITNAIQKLSVRKKQQIAFIEGQNELNEYQVMDISRILSEYYEVRRGRIGGRPGVLDSFKTIIIAKPRTEFSERDKFVLDQYIMKGGNVLWLIENTEVRLDSLFINGKTIAMGSSINIDDQIFKYGVRINPNILEDKQSSPIGIAEKGTDGQPKLKLYPWYYFPILITQNNHVINKYINPIKTEFPGTLDTVSADPEIKKTVLLQSSHYSRIDAVPAPIDLADVEKPFVAEMYQSGQQTVAVLLEGTFKSVFTNRSMEKYFPENPNISVISTGKMAKMIIVGDGDIIKNEVSTDGKPYPIGFDKFSRQTYKGNQEFILNALNYLCDDSGLMSIRSREMKLRLLDTDKIKNNRLMIELVNVVLPLVMVALFGIGIYLFRKKKYAGK
jgi:ABC-2 type transport system permease protein